MLRRAHLFTAQRRCVGRVLPGNICQMTGAPQLLILLLLNASIATPALTLLLSDRRRALIVLWVLVLSHLEDQLFATFVIVDLTRHRLLRELALNALLELTFLKMVIWHLLTLLHLNV